MELSSLTIKKTGNLLRKGECSVSELADAYLQRIKERDSEIGAYLEVFSDVKEQALSAQSELDSGEGGVLTGLPIAIKDNILVQGRKVTSASRILENYVAPYDSTVAEKLVQQKTVLLGRTNMDEFALGSSTEKSAYYPTRNPHDPERVPGGSSGGSAAAVASGQALAALGSDTGGSIRQPAALCGCVGLKPTYGAVSRYGLMAMGSSFDQIGTLTRTVEDTAELFWLLEGEDKRDSTTLPDTARQKRKDQMRKKLRVGVPWHLIRRPGVDQAVVDNFTENIALLEKEGYEVREISLPHLEYALAAYYILMPAELGSNLARIDGMRYGHREEGEDLLEDYTKSRAQLGPEARIRSLVGAFVLSSGYYDAYYNKAYTARKFATRDIKQAFGEDPESRWEDRVDLIATPTSPTPAFKIGERSEDPVQMMMADIFTVPANIAGVPALSVPSGKVWHDGAELPVGLQFMAPSLREDLLFRAASLVEEKIG